MSDITVQTLDKDLTINEILLHKSKYLANNVKDKKVKVDIKSSIFEKVKDYLSHFESTKEAEPTIPEPLPDGDLKSILKNDYCVQFLEALDFEATFELINAGALLELDNLHDLACAKIAHFMKGKTPDEVNQHFTIECQLTNEEAKELGLEVEDDS